MLFVVRRFPLTSLGIPHQRTDVRFWEVSLTASHTHRVQRPWMKTSEAATRCGVTGETLLAWMKAGKLSARKTPGGHYRFDPAEVDALLKDNAATDVEVAV